MTDANPDYRSTIDNLASDTESRGFIFDSDSYDVMTGVRATAYGPVENMVKSFEDGFDLSDFMGATAGLAGQAVGFALDPLGALIGNGLDFLLYAVQPLHDLVGLVTGNPTRFAEAIARWETIRTALDEFAQEVEAVPSKWDGEWNDTASERANERVAELALAIRGIGGHIASIEDILQACAALAQILEEVVKAILTECIKQLLIIWIPALAAAGPTFGASTAAAATQTGISVPGFLMRGTGAVAEGKTLAAVLKAAMSNFNMITKNADGVLKSIAETGLGTVPLAGNTAHNTYFNNEAIETTQADGPEVVNASEEEIWEGLS